MTGCFVSGVVPPESVVTCMAGFATLGRLSARSQLLVGSESVVTSMAGFAARTQPGARTWMPGGLEIGAGRLAAHTRGLLDAAQGPAEST